MNIGLIAGNGQFPIIFAKAAKAKGLSVYAAAHINEATAELEKEVAAIEWIHVGQIRRIIKFFKSHSVSEAVLIGAVFSRLLPKPVGAAEKHPDSINDADEQFRNRLFSANKGVMNIFGRRKFCS